MISCGAALPKLQKGLLVLGWKPFQSNSNWDLGRSMSLLLKSIRKREGVWENLLGIWTMYNWMDLHHLKQQTLVFYLLLSRVMLFCVPNCFVCYPLDRRMSKKIVSYRDVNYNWHNLSVIKHKLFSYWWRYYVFFNLQETLLSFVHYLLQDDEF